MCLLTRSFPVPPPYRNRRNRRPAELPGVS